MNAHEFLEMQHQEIRDTYTKFETAIGNQKEELGKKILTDLSVHSAIEEELYYPELDKAEKKELADEFRAEHDSAKTLISELTAMDTDDLEYEPTMKALMEAVESHIAEEESEGMPEAASVLSEGTLQKLGAEMQERSKELHESTLKRLWAEVTS